MNAAEAVLERDPDNWKALAIRAQARLNGHQEETVIEEIDRLLELRPDEIGLLQAKVEALLKIEREEEAKTLIAELRSRVAAMEDPEPGLAERICGTPQRKVSHNPTHSTNPSTAITPEAFHPATTVESVRSVG